MVCQVVPQLLAHAWQMPLEPVVTTSPQTERAVPCSGAEDDWRSHHQGSGPSVEPQVGGHVSVTRFWRVGVDAGYRFVGGVERHAVDEVRSPTVGMHLQVGWF
jgi:hypothetical protein